VSRSPVAQAAAGRPPAAPPQPLNQPRTGGRGGLQPGGADANITRQLQEEEFAIRLDLARIQAMNDRFTCASGSCRIDDDGPPPGQGEYFPSSSAAQAWFSALCSLGALSVVPSSSDGSGLVPMIPRCPGLPLRNRLMPTASQGLPGFSLVEVIVTASLIALLSGISISSAVNEWRSEQATAVAQELAGWLVLVQCAAMRGARCDITINPSGGTVGLGQTLAQASQSTSGSLTNSCTAFSPLTLEAVPGNARFSISPVPGSFSFTPRGTIAAGSSDPVVITITNQAGGIARCVRLDGLLAITRLGVASGGRCDL